MPPKVIGPYRVLETLGTGGVGTVYRAVDRRTGEAAALKLLSTGPALDPRAARRLAREFETLADLSHPNVVKVYDTGVFQGYPYLAMELIEGLTLRHYLALDPHELSSDQGLARAIRKQRASLNSVARPDDDSGSDSMSEDGDDGSGDYAPNPFTLSSFSEENPSEEHHVGDDDDSDGEFQSGPDSVRRLADLADEPDTDMPVSGEISLPYDVPIAEEQEPPTGKPSDADLELLNRPERLGRLKDVMLQICESLGYIHGHGLIHRDLKPSNIMVDEDRTVRLMDFGLAKFIADDAAVTADGRLVGTFRYMSPEQILGEKLDARADLYSLGVILYELLTGRAPFEAKTPYELWQKVLETEPAPVHVFNPRTDRVMSRIAHRLIRKEPEDRYQTAEEVFEALSE
ncbi:MAG: serine/threonine protein kinase [Myxococcaceae bacterium]|nr:serine/threonine protein kinase [Myxococcaceae bacterium]